MLYQLFPPLVLPGVGLDPPPHCRKPGAVLPLPCELETKSTPLHVQWKGRFIHRNRAKTCLKKIYLYIFRANEFIEMTVKVSLFSRHLHIPQVSDKRYTCCRFCLISAFPLVALEPARLLLQDTRLHTHSIKLNRVGLSRGGVSAFSLRGAVPTERSPVSLPGPGAAAGQSGALPAPVPPPRPHGAGAGGAGGSGCRRAAQAVCVHHFFQVTLGFAGYHKRPGL